MALQNALVRAHPSKWSSRRCQERKKALVLRAQASSDNSIKPVSKSSSSSERHGVKAEASATALPPAFGKSEDRVSERMARLKERALALWQSGDDDSEALGKRIADVQKQEAAAAAEREAEHKILLESRLAFLEDKVLAQTEYIKELNSALSVAKTALGSAMKCLEVPLEIESSIELPRIAGVARRNRTGKESKEDGEEEEEEEEGCDVDSFSNIEEALQKADMLLENSSYSSSTSSPSGMMCLA